VAADRLGLFGGAFDPVHWGHVGAAIECAYQLRLDRVLLVPGGDPPLKAPDAPAAHRFEMVRLAALEYPGLEPSRLELETPGPHYTVGTLRRLKDIQPDAELFLIVGDDAAATLDQWREPHAIRSLATIVTVQRAAYREEAYAVPLTTTPSGEGYDPRARTDPGAGLRVTWPGVAVSSTEIRRRIRSGAPIEYLVPRSVADYLKGHRLYL
jgi:nicotinate-nucleotide adenylyltransferase